MRTTTDHAGDRPEDWKSITVAGLGGVGPRLVAGAACPSPEQVVSLT